MQNTIIKITISNRTVIKYSELILWGEILLDWIVKTFHGFILKFHYNMECPENFKDRVKSAKTLKFSPLEINPLYSTKVIAILESITEWVFLDLEQIT